VIGAGDRRDFHESSATSGQTSPPGFVLLAAPGEIVADEGIPDKLADHGREFGVGERNSPSEVTCGPLRVRRWAGKKARVNAKSRFRFSGIPPRHLSASRFKNRRYQDCLIDALSRPCFSPVLQPRF